MRCATVKDLKKLIENANDDDVLHFRIYSDEASHTLRFASDIANSSSLQAVGKAGFQTSDGDRNVLCIDLRLDLDPKD